MIEAIKPGLYKHYKGNLYIVLGLAHDADDGIADEPHVLYFDVVKHILWHRRWKEWLAPVEPHGLVRYQLVAETKPMEMAGPFAIILQPLDGSLRITLPKETK